STSHEDEPSRIGRYRIIHKIGEGGMGVVYAAQQEEPQRRVALKVIRPSCVTAETVQRFALESQVLARLQHPGIAQIFESGTARPASGPRPYFAMEFVAGQTLTLFCELNRLELGERLELMARVSDAVQHAHSKGVIHRDLKPANVLVVEDGTDGG